MLNGNGHTANIENVEEEKEFDSKDDNGILI